MKQVLRLLAVLSLISVVSFAQQVSSKTSPELRELWSVFQQIEDYKALEQEVPQNLYDRYFELDRLVNPENYGRNQEPSLDELSNICPGITVVGPDSGVVWAYYNNGSTTNKTNNCSYPTCRYGRDAFMVLDVRYKDSVTVSTCGSNFDTYLCIWTGGCCTDPQAVPFASNDNNPLVCSSPLTLQAGITRCFDPGLYYICVDGYGPGSHGSFSVSIFFHGNSCIPTIIEPECPADFSQHEEGLPEGCDAYSNTIFCGQGYCGLIDQQGDLDVYALTIQGQPRDVTVSVYADDTPGRTGYEQGLNSLLRVWPVTCEAPLSVNTDFNGTADGDPVGTDSQVSLHLEPGTYFFEVSGEQGTTGEYEIFVGCDLDEQ
ncbi:MAG: hypothetical protein H6506_00435 [Calditrichaeota bacterium]|nr:hypothetical protein [Calditrichota bacterium]MCB9391103.1 hypothetical protein [Calditrichota bacterium]